MPSSIRLDVLRQALRKTLFAFVALALGAQPHAALAAQPIVMARALLPSPPASGAPSRLGAVRVQAAERGAPWLSLADGRQLLSPYTGAEPLVRALEEGRAEGRALVSGDFDEDGVPDLVCGYRAEGRGALTLMRGNVDAIYPNAPEAEQRRADGTDTDAPFLSPAKALDVPEAVDLVASGDFDADGHLDVVAARVGDDGLWLLCGSGRGELAAARRVSVDGQVTALASGEMNRADGLPDLMVGVEAAGRAKLLVYEGPEGALRSEPEVIVMRAPVRAVALAELDGGYEMDVAVATGREVVVVHGRDRRLFVDNRYRGRVEGPILSRRTFENEVLSVAAGDFAGDSRPELGVLTADGAVRVVSSAALGSQLALRGLRPGTRRLVASRVVGVSGESIVAVGEELDVYASTKEAEGAAAAAIMEGTALSSAGEPEAVLPMRLNSDALSDLVVLERGSSAPTVILTVARATFTVTNTNDSGAGSLRQAIFDARFSPGADSIRFNIPGPVPHTIAPATGLPQIQDPVTLDATTQPGFAGSPVIEISGQSAGGGANGLTIASPTGGNTTIRGFVVNRFSRGATSGGFGIRIITGGGGNIVEGNYAGTDVTGSLSLPNAAHGISIFASSNNTIGGTTTGARNVASGNTGTGIFISGLAGNRVVGNYAGLSADGTASVGGAQLGIGMDGARNAAIGGASAGERNVCSGNPGGGIGVGNNCSGVVVQGNLVGTNPSGTGELGNIIGGIGCSSTLHTIGGPGPGAGNIVVATEGTGLGGAGDTRVENNVVRGSTADGIGIISGHSNVVKGNTVTNSGINGVWIGCAFETLVSRNSVSSSGLLGIDHIGDGVTQNDPGDADFGPNALQNSPTLTSATSTGGTTRIRGRLASVLETTFTIEFFSSPTCHSLGSGEGEIFLGEAIVTTNDAGNAPFDVLLNVSVAAGAVVTATATDPDGNTSEFSACQTVTASASAAIVEGAPGEAVAVQGSSVVESVVATVAVRADECTPGFEALLNWQAPEPVALAPPQNLTADLIGYASAPVAQRERRAPAPLVAAYNIYLSSQEQVPIDVDHLFASVPATQTTVTGPILEGGSFFAVTALYVEGESVGSNTAGIGTANGPKVDRVKVGATKITGYGSGFDSSVKVFVNGLPCDGPPPKANRATTKLTQKGLIHKGVKFLAFVKPGQTVTITFFKNSTKGITDHTYTRP